MKKIFNISILGLLTIFILTSNSSHSSIPSSSQTMITTPQSATRFSPFSLEPLEQEMELVFKAIKKALYLTTIEMMANNPRAVKEYCEYLTSGSATMRVLGAVSCSPVQSNSLVVLDIIVSYLANFIYYPLKENFHIAKKIKNHRDMGITYNQDSLKEYQQYIYKEEYNYWYYEDFKLMDEAKEEYFARFPKQEETHKKIEKSIKKVLSSAQDKARAVGNLAKDKVSNAFSFFSSRPSSPTSIHELDDSTHSTQTNSDNREDELTTQDILDIQNNATNLLHEQETNVTPYNTNYFALFVKNLKHQWKLYHLQGEPADFFKTIKQAIKHIINKHLEIEAKNNHDYLVKQQEELYDWLSQYNLGFTAKAVPFVYIADFFSKQFQYVINHIADRFIEFLYNTIKTKTDEMANYDPNAPQPELIVGENAAIFETLADSFEKEWAQGKKAK